MIRRIKTWWANRPCYTEIFPFNSAQFGLMVTCEEAESWDRVQLEFIQEKHQRARRLATRAEYV